METREAQFERRMVDALRKQVPVKDLPGVLIAQVRQEPERPFDVSFELASGKNRILVFAEIKQSPSPKLLAEIGPWMQRMKSLKKDAAFAVLAPSLSSQAQAYSVANGIDFLDLAGNISIQVPGKFTLQRLGRRSTERNQTEDSSRSMNVFSGRSSRVLRVLLEKPKAWSLTAISKELDAQAQRVDGIVRQPMDFGISQGSISKASPAWTSSFGLDGRDQRPSCPSHGDCWSNGRKDTKNAIAGGYEVPSSFRMRSETE
jgi:hypothetical protein